MDWLLLQLPSPPRVHQARVQEEQVEGMGTGATLPECTEIARKPLSSFRLPPGGRCGLFAG